MKSKTLAFALALLLAACGNDSENNNNINRAGLEAVKLGNVPGPGACGVSNAYGVASVAGVRLSQRATIGKKTLDRLERWLRQDAIPAIGNKGGGLVGISVPSHYACRTRNSLPGARLSEHAKGNAIDISAFILADGTRLTVLNDWNGPNSGLMRKLHSSACGPFGTVLGPNSDRFHQDHFHFDVADYRSGPYCR
jgi:hypothetical protein